MGRVGIAVATGPARRARTEPSHTEFSSGFLTGKELDPDFVDFNSVNRRYHFPLRSLVAFRGTFQQVDLIFVHMGRGMAPFYSYLSGNPLLYTDPLGLQEAEGGKAGDEPCGCCEVMLIEKGYKAEYENYGRSKPGSENVRNPANDNAAARFPNARRFTTLNEFRDGINCFDDKGILKPDHKVRKLRFAAHGNKDVIGTGSAVRGLNEEDGNKLTILGPAEVYVAFDKSKFCHPCEIEILACNVGQGNLPIYISQASGCTVTAYKGQIFSMPSPLNLLLGDFNYPFPITFSPDGRIHDTRPPVTGKVGANPRPR